jgi:hypothetical protein
MMTLTDAYLMGSFRIWRGMLAVDDGGSRRR